MNWQGHKVSVHRMQHHENWTVRDAETGTILFYTKDVVLKDAKLVSCPWGWKRFHESGRKLVYGTITGTLLGPGDRASHPTAPTPVFFRPGDEFFHREDGSPVTQARFVALTFGETKGVFTWG